jgi:hypothetical protein
MKNLGLLVIVVLIVVFGMVSTAPAQEIRCLDGLTLIFGNNNTPPVTVGDIIDYEIRVSVPGGTDICTAYNLDVYFWPSTNENLEGWCSDYTNPDVVKLTSTSLTLLPGGSEVIFDSTTNPELAQLVTPLLGAGGDVIYAYVGVRYTLQPEPVDYDCKEAQNTIAVECPPPCVEITKDACGYSKLGDTVEYEICVTNCGEHFDLIELEVYDDMLSATPGVPLPGFPSILAPGESWCETFYYVVQESDEPGPLVNEAYVVALDACDDTQQVGPVYDDASVTLLHPDIDVTKTCMTPIVPPGGVAEFEIVITNTGDVELDVTSTDPAAPPVQPTRFAAGESRTYTVYMDCPPPSVLNEITVYGDIPDEYCNLPNPPVEATASAECLCSTCVLECTKDVTPEVSKAGHDVVYTICAINAGDLCDLTLIQVYDTLLGDLTSHFSGTLLAGVTECYTYTYTIPEGTPDPLLNEVTFVYQDSGGTEYTCTETATVQILHPDLDVRSCTRIST